VRCAAASAATAARAEVIATYDAATVLVTVTSQVELRPSRHGIDVNPPGRLPSDLVKTYRIHEDYIGGRGTSSGR